MAEDMRNLLVLIPAYNDWDSVALLLPALDASMVGQGTVDLLVVDDCSRDTMPEPLLRQPLGAIRSVRVLRLRRNLGHQRAIAIGLTYAEQHLPSARVLVMDGDGEDLPSDVPRLLAESAAHPEAIVFAARHKRSESIGFRIGYATYRTLHRLVTGMGVNVGNFSVVPASAQRQLVVVSDLWNHYAAAVFRARIVHRAIPTSRGTRLAGKAKMNFSALAAHGLSALAVHGEVVGTRLMLASGVLGVIVFLGLCSILAIRFGTTLAIPGWATTAAGLAAVLLTQVVALSVLFAFFALAGRTAANFIPLRDYAYFVDHCHVILGSDTGAA